MRLSSKNLFLLVLMALPGRAWAMVHPDSIEEDTSTEISFADSCKGVKDTFIQAKQEVQECLTETRDHVRASCQNAKQYVQDKATQAVEKAKDVVRNAAHAAGQSATNATAKTAEATIVGFGAGMQRPEFTAGMENTLRSAVQGMSDEQGQQVLREFFASLGDTSGAGFASFKEHFKEGGQAYEALQQIINGGGESAFNAFSAHFEEGGAGYHALERMTEGAGKAFLDQVRNHFAEGGAGRGAVNSVVDGALNGASRAMRSNFAQGGALDLAAQEADNFLNRRANNLEDTFNRSFDRVVTQTNARLNRFEEESGMARAGVRATNAGAAFTEAMTQPVAHLADAWSRLTDVFANSIQHLNTKEGKIHTTLFAGGLLSVWYGSKVVFNLLEARLKTPDLVIEKRDNSWKKLFKSWFVSIKPQHSLNSIILEKTTKDRLELLVASTKNVCDKIRKGHKGLKYRDLLLYGPPGTGKTLAARVLAEECGMDWVMMTGSSFSKYDQAEAIAEMDKLFIKARKSKNLMIIIDEADSFLGERTGQDSNSKSYQLLNNFLNYTGEGSDRFMLVFVTNHPEKLDEAMATRIKEAIEIKLPAVAEREKILTLYRDKVLLNAKNNTAKIMQSVRTILNKDRIAQMAQQTEGLSGRELSTIVDGIKSYADVSKEGVVTDALVAMVVNNAVTMNKNSLQGGFAAVYGKKKNASVQAVTV